MKTNTLNEPIQTYWWNCRKKTLDFSGTVGECLKAKGIKFTTVKNKRLKDAEAYKFTFELSGRLVTYTVMNPTLNDAAIECIGLFMQILGDKALITSRFVHKQINF